MNNERLEELAALHSVDLLDEAEKRELLHAAAANPEADKLLRDFAEAAAMLAYEAPEVQPPPRLRLEIMRRLPAHAAATKIVSFPQWIAYAIAACLMILGIAQAVQIQGLKGRIGNMRSSLLAKNAEADRLRQSNVLKDLRLAMLEEAAAAQANTAYAAAHVMVAWDPIQHRGMVSMKNLPAPPAGRDYQLWVLDPKAASPISAGMITGSRTFAVQPVSTSHPGFAVSLEPSGGEPAPTGPILFAVAPGQ